MLAATCAHRDHAEEGLGWAAGADPEKGLVGIHALEPLPASPQGPALTLQVTDAEALRPAHVSPAHKALDAPGLVFLSP